MKICCILLPHTPTHKMGKYYTDMLQDVEGLILPVEKTMYANNIYWVYGLVLGHNVQADSRALQKLMEQNGIGTRTFFWCMHEQPVYRNSGVFSGQRYPNAEYLARKGFYIPSGLSLTEGQMEKVTAGVKKVVAELKNESR